MKQIDTFLVPLLVLSVPLAILWMLNLRLRFSGRRDFPDLKGFSGEVQSSILTEARESAGKSWKPFVPSMFFVLGLSLGSFFINSAELKHLRWFESITLALIINLPTIVIARKVEIQFLKPFIREVLHARKRR